jgi:hypothetical protein
MLRRKYKKKLIDLKVKQQIEELKSKESQEDSSPLSKVVFEASTNNLFGEKRKATRE